ncbi:MAG TPA: hypothetical protein VGC69_14495 [Bordetella sp.]
MIKQAKRAGLVLAATALSGCSIGIGTGGSLSGSFEAPVGYRQAYQTALAQAQLCLVGDGAYRVEGRVDETTHAGRLSVVPKLVDGREMARVEVSAAGDARARVRVEMWGESLWNANAMRAMHDAVYFSAPSCAVYIPPQSGESPDAWFSKK